MCVYVCVTITRSADLYIIHQDLIYKRGWVEITFVA